jgi:RNA polymerase sigma factor (sigma-70 family)
MNKEYKIKVSVKNNLILKAIAAAGYKNVNEFAKFNDLNANSITSLIRFSQSVYLKNGEISKAAQTLLDALDLMLEDLWTPEQLNLKIDKNYVERELEQSELNMLTHEMKFLPSAESEFESKEFKKFINSLLNDSIITLTEKEQKVLKMRFGLDGNEEHTLESISQKMSVTRERIRQIESKALRKMRHPSKSNKILDAMECEK